MLERLTRAEHTTELSAEQSGCSDNFGFYYFPAEEGKSSFKTSKEDIRFAVLVATNGTILINQCGNVVSLSQNSSIILDPSDPFEVTAKESSSFLLFLSSSVQLRSSLGYSPSTLWRLSLKNNSTLGKIAVNLLKSITHAVSSLHPLEIEALGSSFLYAVGTWISSTRRKMKGISEAMSPNERLRQATEKILQERLSDPELDFTQIAQRVGVSARYLSACYQSVNQTVMSCLKELRLNAAAGKLSQHRYRNVPISQIAKDCGFKTAEHFSRAFREKYGQSPSQWKKAHRSVP